MLDTYKNDLKWAESNRKSLQSTAKKLGKNKRTDQIINNLHKEVFEEVDCLECANCCRTTGPLLTSQDIKRLSNRLKRSEKQFVEQYLKVDEDGDFVFKNMPCPFLGSDNHCEVYEDRPKACRRYPHTDEKGQAQILNLTRKNAMICPAVSQIFQRIADEL